MTILERPQKFEESQKNFEFQYKIGKRLTVKREPKLFTLPQKCHTNHGVEHRVNNKLPAENMIPKLNLEEEQMI